MQNPGRERLCDWSVTISRLCAYSIALVWAWRHSSLGALNYATLELVPRFRLEEPKTPDTGNPAVQSAHHLLRARQLCFLAARSVFGLLARSRTR